MSIEHIRKYILCNAQKEAGLIIKKAEEQFLAEAHKARLSLEKQYQEKLQDDGKRLEDEMKQAINALKNDYRMKLLEMKNGLIDDILTRAILHIQSMSDSDYVSLLKKWIGNIPPHLEGQVFVNERDLNRIADDFVHDINKDRKIKIIVSTKTIYIKGGFILKTRNYEIDYSLETMVKNLRPKLIPELSNLLRL
ncbi:MAG: V-type ATP synthase subunit E [Candidatus Brocadiaceae bacterium]